MLIEIPFEDAEHYEPLPEEDYQMDCLEAEVVPPEKEGERPYINLSLQVVKDSNDSEEHAGKTRAHRVYMQIPSDKEKKAKDGRGLWGVMIAMVEEVFDAFGVDKKRPDTTKFAGRRCWVTCKHEVYEGRNMDRFSGFRPL